MRYAQLVLLVGFMITSAYASAKDLYSLRIYNHSPQALRVELSVFYDKNNEEEGFIGKKVHEFVIAPYAQKSFSKSERFFGLDRLKDNSPFVAVTIYKPEVKSYLGSSSILSPNVDNLFVIKEQNGKIIVENTSNGYTYSGII